MSHYSINAGLITSWESFHNIFSKEFSFPSYYEHNMNEWIDCMSDIAEQEEIICLNIENINDLKKRHLELYEAIVESTQNINRRFSEEGKIHCIALSFFEKDECNQNNKEIKKMVTSAKERGFIYRHEILEVLSIDICETEQLNDIVEFINDMGISIR